MIKYFFIFATLILLLFSQKIFSETFEKDIVSAAIERTNKNIRYDGSYFSIDYPNGDVPSDIGVCTDVIIRSYRKLGTDLQKIVHEDITNNFDKYPSKRIWNLKKPDKNIDHRRVPNLQIFFKRNGISKSISKNNKDYKPGDLVTWILPGNKPHIGIVTDKKDYISGNPLIVHNIGNGPEIEDMLFEYKITGHYKFVPMKYDD